VGTFQYMAPEQLEGKGADARSDIFALGAVLYELAMGKPAFQGGTPASVVAAVLASEPSPVPTLKPTFPPALDRLIRTALVKNPDDRWQSAHDIAVALASIASDDTRPASSSSPLWQVVAAALAIAVVAIGLVLILKSPRPHRPLRLSIPLPGSAGFHSLAEQMLAVSPDGSQVAFVASDRTGHQLLWVRALGANEARALPGTDDAGN
jgi:serine/threonine protein kinase